MGMLLNSYMVASAAPIGGVIIGTPGEVGTIYEGYKLAGGEEFNSLDILTAVNPSGKYVPSHRRRARRAINSGSNDYYWSPEHTGYADANRGVAIGSGVNDLLNVSGSTLNMATRLATTTEKNLAWTTTASTGPQRPQSASALHSACYQAVKWPCVIEARIKVPTGAQLPAGGWPAFWTENVLPTWANTGEFDFEWVDDGNLFNNFITGTSVNDAISSTIVDSSDNQWHTFSMVVTAATIKFYKDGTLMITAVKRPDSAVTGPMFWWLRIGVDLTPGQMTGVGMSAYSAAAWAGVTAQMEIDYVRLWTLPEATDLGYKGVVSTINIDFTGSISETLPSKTALWGSSSVTEYLIFQPIESSEPGLTQLALTGAPNTWYGQTVATNGLWGPTFLAWNPTTRAITGSGFDQSGRLIGHIVAWDDTNGGLAGFARVVINVGPRVTAPALSYANGASVSYDLYAACDAGMLTTNTSGTKAKTISVTGLSGSGLSYSDTTGLLTGTFVSGSYTMGVTVTNSIGQTVTTNVPITLSAGFAPTDISGLQIWFDASDTASISDTAGAVSQINDKSGNSRHLTAIGVAQPTTGTRTVNGLNGLDFDGLTDYLTTASRIFTGASARTYFMVFKKDTDPAGTMRLFSERASTGGFLGLTQANRARVYHDGASGTSVNRQTIDSTLDTTNAFIVIGRWAGTEFDTGIKVYTNGGAEDTYAVTTNAYTPIPSANGTALTVGADIPIATPANFFDGILCEGGIYNKVLSTTEMNNLGAYLGAKFGITWTTIP